METTDSQFRVDLGRIHLNRKPGISGMMRVKDDAEFIEDCVSSCIDALDELVIVYNDCSDNSPQIIRSVAEKFPDKIRVYNYEPKILCGALTKSQYERAKSLPDDSVELLSNYYNYALSRTTRTHVMKIDADQIYFTSLLKGLCDRIRSASLFKLTPADWVAFARLARSLRYLDWRPGESSRTEFYRYRKVLEYLCAKGLFAPALSGINIFRDPDGTEFVTQGLKTNGLNILGQFNGTADHLIFKVRKGTRFVPFDCSDYSRHTSAQYTYIEKLVGAPRALPWGFMWWHLNTMRARIYGRQLHNLKNHTASFVQRADFMMLTPEEIISRANPDFIPELAAVNYAFYWTFCKNEIPSAPVKYQN